MQVQTVETQERQNLNISCRTRDPVEWRTTRVPWKLFTDEPKYVVEGNWLVIRNVSTGDSASYKCYNRNTGLLVRHFVITVIGTVIYLYNECLPWYNVVLTSRVHSSVKYSQQSQLRTRAMVE